MNDCLFCRIVSGEIPSKKVYEDDHTFAFEDINPQAPTHVLIIPKKHVAGLKEAQADNAALIGQCHLAAATIARQRNIRRWVSYRTQCRTESRTVGVSHARTLARWTDPALAARLAARVETSIIAA